MKEVCDNKYNNPLKILIKDTCKLMAKGFYEIVENFGKKH